MSDKKSPELVSNRKAHYDYEILDTLEAGIVLLGTEIKSLRNHGGSLQDAYVEMKGSHAILMNASIAPYSFGNIHNHEERRPRELLLHKRELAYFGKQVKEKGLTIIPLSMFLNNRGYVKVKIGLAKGKKKYDKKEAIKERDIKRSIKEGET